MAVGVGTAKILGRVHAYDIVVLNKVFFNFSNINLFNRESLVLLLFLMMIKLIFY